MNYTVKKILAYLLTLVMLFNIFPVAAFAEGEGENGASDPKQVEAEDDNEEQKRGDTKGGPTPLACTVTVSDPLPKASDRCNCRYRPLRRHL